MGFLPPEAWLTSCLVGPGQGFQVLSANRSRHVGLRSLYQQAFGLPEYGLRSVVAKQSGQRHKNDFHQASAILFLNLVLKYYLQIWEFMVFHFFVDLLEREPKLLLSLLQESTCCCPPTPSRHRQDGSHLQRSPTWFGCALWTWESRTPPSPPVWWVLPQSWPTCGVFSRKHEYSPLPRRLRDHWHAKYLMNGC